MKVSKTPLVVNYFGIYLFLPLDFEGGYLATDRSGEVYFYPSKPEYDKVDLFWYDDYAKEHTCVNNTFLDAVLVLEVDPQGVKPEESLYHIV